MKVCVVKTVVMAMNAVKGFWTLCLIGICLVVGGYLLLRDFGPYVLSVCFW